MFTNVGFFQFTFVNTSKTSLHTLQGESFRIAVKTALLRRGLTITALAGLVDRPRSSVSKAVNQDRFPQIRTAIIHKLKLEGKGHE